MRKRKIDDLPTPPPGNETWRVTASRSDSDWYAYPDSNMHGDSDDNEETRKLNRCFGNHYDESCYFHDPNDL